MELCNAFNPTHPMCLVEVSKKLHLNTCHFSSLLGWSGFPQAEYISTHWYFSPYSRLGVFCEPIAWMHNKNAISCQTIHLPIWCLPFGSLLLVAIKIVSFQFLGIWKQKWLKIMHHSGKKLFTPRKMFFDESNPAA